MPRLQWDWQALNGLLHFAVVLQRDNEAVPEIGGLDTVKQRRVALLFNKVIQRLLPGDKFSFGDVVDQINLGADALGLGLRIAFVDIDQNLVFLFQIPDHGIDIVKNQGESCRQ